MGGSITWKVRHEGIVLKKVLVGAEPGLAMKEGTRLNSASSKATASRRAPRCETGEIALTEKRSVVDFYSYRGSYRGASVYARAMREPSYKKT